MTADGIATQVSAERLKEIDAALCRYEDAVGYGTEGLAGFSGCLARAWTVGRELVGVTAGIDWDAECVCEAPPELLPRLAMAWSIYEWLDAGRMEAAAANAEYVIEVESEARAAAAGPDTGYEEYSIRRQRRRELALYILESADPDGFATSDVVDPADIVDLTSVAGWWRATERTLRDRDFAVQHDDAIYEARAVHEACGLTETHALAMHAAFANISEYVINDEPINTEDVRNAITRIDLGEYAAADLSECDCPMGGCVLPATPWMGIERKVGVRAC